MEKKDPIGEFKKFGSKMYIIGILMVFTLFIFGIAHMVISIFIILSLKHIKTINEEMNNTSLKKFQIRILLVAIISLIGYTISIVITIITNFFIWNILSISFPPSAQSFGSYLTIFRFFLFEIIFVLVLGFVMAILNVTAWKELNNFFRENLINFPSDISKKAIEGSGQLKKAYILLVGSLILISLYLLLFISPYIIPLTLEQTYYSSTTFFFTIVLLFIIPGIFVGILGFISYIYRILGYFDLSHLKNV